MGLFTSDQVRSFEKISWSISGMRGSREYEIIDHGECSEVAEYGIYYRKPEDERRLERRAVCPTEQIVELLNACHILSWNGFEGRHPGGVRDGEMFALTATVNEAVQIKASGSENFPKHFREFRRTVNELLNAQTAEKNCAQKKESRKEAL